MEKFWISFLAIVNSMGPYLLLGFLIAGILHVFVPKKFYNKYLRIIIRLIFAFSKNCFKMQMMQKQRMSLLG